MAFPPLENSDYFVVTVSTDFPSNSQWNVVLIGNQVYSNTQVPTQGNTSQQESTRINTSLTRVNEKNLGKKCPDPLKKNY